MKIAINANEINMLGQHGIVVDLNREYAEDDVFGILDRVRDIEVFYAQDSDTDRQALRLASEYGNLADKIQNMIPEE